MQSRTLALLAVCIGATAVRADAHSFGVLYTLPMPVEMYLYGASAALVASFLIIGLFASPIGLGATRGTRAVADRVASVAIPPAARTAARGVSVALLLLAVLTGLVGTPETYKNINMTLFWVIFFLGLTYLTPLVGNFYAWLNPWVTIVEALERLVPEAFLGKRSWAAALSYYPAFALYVGFIWLELFGHTTPRSLSIILAGYTLLNVVGAWLFGKASWFKYVEFFGYYSKLLSKLSAVSFDDSNGKLKLRFHRPFKDLMDDYPKDLSQLLFILFMLSSTAFDGLRDTVVWVALYWKYFYRAVLTWFHLDMISTYPAFQHAYATYQTLLLPLTAAIYLAIYLCFVRLSNLAARSQRTTLVTAFYYGYTLIPIAFVYSLSHYFTLFIDQGAQLFRLASDPFGFGWNLFGTARTLIEPYIDIGIIWNIQVSIILVGHIISVYAAHMLALRLGGRKAAMIGQLPILVLMVLLTAMGLLILSLPIQAGVTIPSVN